jgi:hypothetical protein
MRVGGLSSFENDAGGFRITIAPTLLSISAWGYWSPDVAEAFKREAEAIAQKVTLVPVFVLDAADLKPQGSEGQDALRVLFKGLAAMNLAKGSLIAKNLFTKMQVVRLLRECGLDQRVTSED